MRKLVLISAWLALPALLHAQPAFFYHLTTGNGLTDNNTQCVTIDRNGFLWIGTANGLNRYDGYSVIRYSAKQYPGLCSDNITALFCDSHNRVWTGTPDGITMIDENRRFHTIIINDSIKTNYSCEAIMETESQGIVIHTSRGSFRLDEKNNHWVGLPFTVAIHKVGLRDNTLFKDEQYIQTGRNELIILDYRTQQSVFDLLLPFSITACRLNDDEIIAASYKGKLFRISVSQRKIIREYTLTRAEGGKTVNSSINRVREAPDGKIIISGSGGLFLFDPVSETFSSYSHDPLRAGSISAGAMEKIFCDTTGNIFITSTGQGLSYFNILEYKAASKTAFITPNNEIYDGYINDIEKDSKDRLWLAGNDCFLVWDKNNNHSSIYRYYYPFLNASERPVEVNCIYFDRRGQSWIGTQGGGLGLFNESNGSFIKFSQDSSHGLPNFANNFVRDIIPVGNDSIWIATNAGIVTFNINTYRYDTLHNSPALKTLHNKIIVKCFKAADGRIWLSTLNYGLYCYDPRTSIIKKYAVIESKPGVYYSFAEDNAGNIYIAGSNGFIVIDRNDKINYYNAANGLRYEDCEALLRDKDGNIWISNRDCLAKFDPVKKTFHFFDEKSGLTDAGFRPHACYDDDDDGQQYWGTIKGLSYFSPSSMYADTSMIKPLIYQADLADTSFYLTNSPSIDLAYNKNVISFSFAAVNFYNEKNILYQYRLEGLDKEWVNSFGNRQVRYSSLPPGNYVFKLRDSRDGIHWTEAANSIRVKVHPAFWQTGWFQAAFVLLLALLAYWLFRMRISKIKEREKLKREYERKIATVEMGSLRAQMNPHFMFNSLNSINNFILKNDPDNASGYLTKFSRLMRLILDNSRSEWVLLENELKALELYIELEALRFDDAFDHQIEITEDVKPDAVLVPPMIIQPYVENAIWHGLMHRKQAGGKLDIHIWKNDGMLNIEIEDNGIGREEAKKRKSKTATKQKSHGMEITTQRLEIVNKLYDVHASVAIKDITNAKGEAEGTVVLLNMLYKTS